MTFKHFIMCVWTNDEAKRNHSIITRENWVRVKQNREVWSGVFHCTMIVSTSTT
jgi:hypothetical protein